MNRKNPTITFILALFLGMYGGHYFYLGKYKKAILYLFTVGLFGIGWLYDIFKYFLAMTSSKKSEPIVQIETEIESEVLSDEIEPGPYLQSFEGVNQYNFDKELELYFLKSLKRTREVDYDRFMKVSKNFDNHSTFVVFDLETTGLKPRENEIIEIGAIRYVDNEPCEMFHTYIKPKKKISARITQINGITNDMVQEAPSIQEVLPYFLDFIGDDTLVAHNVKFDMSFILHQLYINEYKKPKNKTVDTLDLARDCFVRFDENKGMEVPLKNYKLMTLKEKLGLGELGSHNAIDDCKVCGYIYLKTMEYEYCTLEID